MKSCAFAGIVLALFCVCSVAQAGDAAVYKAPPLAPATSMPGMFYAGFSIGGRWSDTDWTTTETGSAPQSASTRNLGSFDSSTLRIDGHVGHMWRIAPQWALGIEGDLAWGDSSKTVIGIPGTCCGGVADVKEKWDGSLRGRFGVLLTPPWLLYATGGIAWQNVEIDASCAPTSSFCTSAHQEAVSSTRTGWTIGGGLEVMLRYNWLVRLEYRFSDYGRLAHVFFADVAPDRLAMNQSLKTETLLLGVAYKFGSPLPAMVKR